ncbi:MAG: diaminopimelate epimerase [Lachnospiraceae bacterium]
MKVVLEKYHGLGNDYLVFDPNKNKLHLNEERVRLICNRNFGVGSDGILEGPILEDGLIRLKIWNPDGSEAKNSGNGVQIFAKYLKDGDYVQKNQVKLETASGLVSVRYLNEEGTRLRVSMGRASFWSNDIPVAGERREVIDETMVFGKIPYKVTGVSVGNPHCVIFLNDISKEMVCKIGELAEKSRYFPEQVNTQLMQVLDRTHIQIQIYERGAGYTLASGSSGCAAAAAAFRLGLTGPKMYVSMPGGTLEIEILEDGMILMTGKVGYVGKINLGSGFVEQLRAME